MHLSWTNLAKQVGKTYSSLLFGLLLTFLFCSFIPNTSKAASQLESISTFSKDRCNAIFGRLGSNQKANYAFETYRFIFTNTYPGPFGNQASALIVLPIEEPGLLLLQDLTLLYQHGTITSNNDAPTRNQLSVVSCLYGSQGYALLIPDYLGFGVSQGFHPYMHSESMAHHNLDLLNAIRKSTDTKLTAISKDLAVLGYSQGGHSTLAVHRAIEAIPNSFKRRPYQTDLQINSIHTEHVATADAFSVQLSIPMAGAYDLSGVSSLYMMTRPDPFFTNLYAESNGVASCWS